PIRRRGVSGRALLSARVRDNSMTSSERAQRIVDAYAKGVICSGEVLNQLVDHISEGEVEIYMRALSPELIRKFEQSLEQESDHPLATPEDLKRWRHAEGLIRTWLRHRPEP